MDFERIYEVEGEAPELVEAQVRERIAALLTQLATNDAVRAAVGKDDPDLLKEFDEFREEVKKVDQPQLSETSIFVAQEDGNGIEPGTVLILVTLGPPILEHFVAPVAVHVCTSVWDKYVLPELESWFKRFRRKK